MNLIHLLIYIYFCYNASMAKYHIPNNSVEETLVIPLYGRLIVEERYPSLSGKRDTKRIIESLDYDFEGKRKKMTSVGGLYGALECVQREFDLAYEAKAYLASHPKAAVVNLGCGLLDIFCEVDNGQCKGYNIDFSNVIGIRNAIMPPSQRERNLGYDLNDHAWMDEIDISDGAIFLAAGVFYYFKREDALALFNAMSVRFKGSSLAFDTCNKKGLKLMLRTFIKEAGIKDVGAFFGLDKPEEEIRKAQIRCDAIQVKSYMHGYRKLKYSFLHKLFNILMENVVKGRIVRLDF